MPFDSADYEPEDEITRLLDAAQALIGTPGKWNKGHLERGGRRCAIGAVHTMSNRLAAGDEVVQRRLYIGGINELQDALPSPWLGVPDYNDARDVMHKHIMMLYERAKAQRRAKILAKVTA